MGKLYAGAAKISIVPPQSILEELMVLNPKSAFKGVGKDVFVRCIALTDYTETCLIFSFESNFFPGQRIFREKLQKEFGVHPDAVMLGNTHNHQMVRCVDPAEAPPVSGSLAVERSAEEAELNDRLMEFFHGKALEAARTALTGAVPAKMGYTSGASYINASRDWATPVGGLQNSDYGGYSDRELVVMRVDTVEGDPIALLVNYGVHSNMLYVHRFNGKYPYIAGDLGGEIMEFVENAHANKVVCAWVEAAAGDQNPLFFAHMPGVKAEPDGTFSRTQGELDLNATILIMEHLAQVQGLEILETERKIQAMTTDFSLRYGRTERTIPGKVNARTAFDLNFSGEQDKSKPRRSELLPEELEGAEIIPADPVTFKFHLAVVNGLAFCGVNTEPYAYLGRMIKDVLPYPKAMIFAIDAGHTGYTPDVRKSKKCGFGTLDSRAQSQWDTEEVFFEGFRQLAKQLEQR